jgi:hypothetical protein
MLDASVIFYLAMFTLSSGLVFGVWQYARVTKSLESERSKNQR